MAKVSISTLLDAGAHFGHQTHRWNPKMKPYIFGSRGDIYILDLKQTLTALDKAYSFAVDLASKGGVLLFVGTKKQAQGVISEAANRCGMPYVNSRWLGGTLTNFATIRSRVDYMEELEAMEANGRMDLLTKKEQISLSKKLTKLESNLNGIRNLKRLPDALFVIDTCREEIAVREANRLNIPVIGTLDTNCDPDGIDYGIPANDDAIRSVRLLTDVIADAVVEGMETEVTVSEMEGDNTKETSEETAEGSAEETSEESREESIDQEKSDEAEEEGEVEGENQSDVIEASPDTKADEVSVNPEVIAEAEKEVDAETGVKPD